MNGDARQPMTIGRGVRCAAARAGDRPALVHGKKTLGYRALVRRMAQVANLAAGRFGLSAGDRVALIAPNCLPYVELVAGLSDLGVIVATLSARLTRPELADILADCTPRLLIVHPDCAAAIDPDWAKSFAMLWIDDDYEALLGKASDRATLPMIEETEPFAIAYTSGTTGRPKGVLLSHRSRALTFLAMAAEYRCFGPGDHFLALAPMAHGAGFVFACAALHFGGVTELFDGGDPEAIVARLAPRDVTGIFMVPTHFARLFDLPDRAIDHGLATIISNAAALPQRMKEHAIARFGPGLLHETYGSTEGGIVTNIRPDELLARPGSVGRPFPHVEVALLDEDGEPVGPGATGELFSRSPASFSGYWKRPDDTAQAIRDGWVTVGDLATRDGDGFVTIADRKTDIVVTGGMNVSPREVENVIAALPGVREVAVVGRPDREWGESLHAFIVPSAGAAIERDAILAACRERLAGFKTPREISLIDELPRNAGGKILKAALRRKTA